MSASAGTDWTQGPTMHAPGPATAAPLRQLLAGAVGNVLEWYDFAAYGYFAAILGRNFFPSGNPVISLAAAFGVFAAAFLMRPIGGVLFGHVGDRFGRQRALLASAGLMTLATIAIGCLPTYATAGAAAPLLLILLRLLQGLSVGGEYASSIVFLVEHSHPSRRGVIGSLAAAGAIIGILLGSAVGVVASACLTPAQLADWGWRIPFLLGLALGGPAFALRRTMAADAAPPAGAEARMPLAEALESDWRDILRGAAACASISALFYLVFVYLVTLMQQVDGLPARRALEINTLSMLVLLVATPAFGALSDRIGRKPVMLGSVIGTTLLAVPLFGLLLTPALPVILAGQAGFAVLAAAFIGPMQAMLVELHRGAVRCTALSLSYNVATALIGGTSPMVAVYLVSEERLNYGPAWYMMLLSAIALAGLLTIPDRTGRPLR